MSKSAAQLLYEPVLVISYLILKNSVMMLRSGVLRRYQPRPKKKKTESKKIKWDVQLMRCLHIGVQYNMLTYGDEHEDGWETER